MTRMLSRTSILALAILAAPGGSSTFGEEPTPPGAEGRQPLPGAFRFRVGKVRVTALSDGTVPINLHDLLRDTTPEEIDRLLARSFLANPVEASINAFLVEDDSRRVLVDTGAGELFGPGLGGKLPVSLIAVGCRPEQVDDILITHVHTDHFGGLVVGGKLGFPNATVHVAREDADFFLEPSNAERAGYDRHYFDQAEKTLGPCVRAGKVRTFSGRTPILPGITAIPTPGHTPGSSAYLLESEGDRIEFWGDLIHVAQVQFPRPSITIIFDVDRSAAARQRAVQFDQAARERKLVAAPHLPFPGVGHLRAEDQGYTWVPLPYRDREAK
jgi:glyoxylase-like metal-dependent hydrolase (beta-lactamase superfamily II)